MWRFTASLASFTLPALALVILILGSTSVSAAQDTPGTCPIGGYAITACPAASDSVIRDQVVSRLSGSVASARYPITVGVCQGVVTLRGLVQTVGKRDLAMLFASSIRGVVAICNELSVDPTTADDLTLVGDVRRAFNKSYIDSKQVQVQASQGVVQLTGSVTMEIDREQATQVAASVPGVTAVYNNITVRGPSGSPF
jgi:osmotically-inducible protein OsmY